MLPRTVLLALLTALVSAQPALAQSRFEWKLKVGEKFYLEEVVEQDITVTLFGNPVQQKATTKRVSEFVVKALDSDGYVLEQEILSWHHVDKKPGGADMETHLEQYLGNSRFTIRLLRSGVIGRFGGYQDFMQRFNEVAGDEAKLVSQLLTEDALRSPLAMAFDVLPRRAVKQGDHFEKTIAIPLGPLGTCMARSIYTYQGDAKGLDQFSLKGEFTFEQGKRPVGDDNLKIVKLDLKSPGTTGSVAFDRATGRLVSCTMSLPMSGSMTMEGKGMKIDMLLEGSEKRTIRLTKTNPHNGSGTRLAPDPNTPFSDPRQLGAAGVRQTFSLPSSPPVRIDLPSPVKATS
jgi:hypothetical protein